MVSIIILPLFLLLLFVILYKTQNTLFILETPTMYYSKILPYMKRVYKTNTKWMFDVLENKTNQTIYTRTPNFVVCRDVKWVTNKKEDIYLLAIPDERIMTIRDLRKRHIPLLESMKNEMTRIAVAFRLNKDDLVFFFHYMPSIFQLHLHCCLKNNHHAGELSRGIYFYDSVVERLKRDEFYWKNATMNYSLSIHNRMCIDLYLK